MAVDGNRLAGNLACRIRGKKENRIGDIVSRDKCAHRCLTQIDFPNLLKWKPALLCVAPDHGIYSGAIINISSTAALHGYPLRSAYAASKWAMMGLMKTWAMELGPEGIRVNAVCPTSVEGDRIDAVIRRDAEQRGLSFEQVRDVYLRQTSMRTFVTPDDVADTILFLASDTANKISGQSISVDGHTEGLSNWLD